MLAHMGHVPAISSESLQRLVAGTRPAMTVHHMPLAFSSYRGDRADQGDCAKILAWRAEAVCDRDPSDPRP
jgi:hypothetical protein